jgi:hypothetical protein
MAKRNFAIVLRLLCLLAATSATGAAEDVPQDEFKIEGSASYLRGMYSMIEASKFNLELLLSEGFGIQRSQKEIHERSLELCERHYELDQGRSKKHSVRSKERKYFSLGSVRIIQALADIGDLNRRCCCSDQWKLFLFVNQIGILKRTKNTAFENYVNHFGRRKLARCAPDALDFMRNMHAKTTTGFDTFFKALFRLPDDADDRQLYERLRDTNLLVDELDFAPTLKLPEVFQAVRWVRKVGDNYELKDGDDVMAFISRTCTYLSHVSHGMLDVILLSEDSQMRSQLDDKVRKWIEYDHACWYVTKYARIFVAHVDRLLGTQSI